MFEHDCLDTYFFGCLICKSFIFLYLYLFSATVHVSHIQEIPSLLLSLLLLLLLSLLNHWCVMSGAIKVSAAKDEQQNENDYIHRSMN